MPTTRSAPSSISRIAPEWRASTASCFTPTLPSLSGRSELASTSSASIFCRSPATRSTRPNGVGALFVRRGVSLEPLIHDAGHEGGRRAGTESALLAVGLGKACELARDLTPMARVRPLRKRFWGLQEQFGDRVALKGHSVHRLPNTLNVSFVGRIGAEILGRLDAWAASTGFGASLRAASSYPPFWRPWVSRPRRAWGPSASASGHDVRRNRRSGRTSDQRTCRCGMAGRAIRTSSHSDSERPMGTA
jgi:hypothetical protein